MDKKKVIECLNNIGIIPEETDNFLLSDYIENSVTFISFIIEIEQTFDVEVPDEYLVINVLNTIDDVCLMIDNINEGKSLCV